MKKKVNPALIIGLGGSGYKSVFETKVSLLKRYGEIPECIRLICFDTDVTPLQKVEREILYVPKGENSVVKKLVKFDKSEAKPIPIKDPRSFLNHEHIKSWIDDGISRGIQPSMKGASQIRQKGRFAFYENYGDKDIEGVIEKALSDINSYQLQSDSDYEILGNPKIHLIFSPAGGTGGGTFLDFAITIQNLTQGKLSLSAWMVLPSFYDQFDACLRVHQNSYAAFKEIDHLMGVDADKDRPWSNHDLDNPYSVKYDGTTDISLNQLSIFDNVFVFDKKMKNGKEMDGPQECFARIGDVIYEFISGPGDEIFETMKSNFETDIATPSNQITGSKRRNYFSIGIGHISMDKSLIKEMKTISIIEKMIKEYTSSSSYEVSLESEKFLSNSNLNEQGSGMGNDQIIDSLYNPIDFRYDKEGSLYPPDFKKGCHTESQQSGVAFMTRWIKKFSEITKTNTKLKMSSFNEALRAELKRILSTVGGVNDSISFLNYLAGQFRVMRAEMATESAAHNITIKNHKNTLTDTLSLIKEEENSLNPFGKSDRIKDECENYASKIELIVRENMDTIRKEQAERLLSDFENKIQKDLKLLSIQQNILSTSFSNLSSEMLKLKMLNKSKQNYVTDLSWNASNELEITPANMSLIISNFKFEECMLDSDNHLSNFMIKIKKYVSSLDIVSKGIDDINIESVCRNLSNTDIKNKLGFLEVSSSNCAQIDYNFTTGTGIPKVNNIGFVTTNDKVNSIVSDNANAFDWELKRDSIVSSGDDERITMVQCEGPFPINALLSLKKSRKEFMANENRSMGKIFSHIDTFFDEKAQDLYKDDSIKDALIYFGIASALEYIKCNTSKYIANFAGDDVDLHNPGASNKKDRDYAFNYFKKNKELVSYIKNEFEDYMQKDPKGTVKMLIEHFDTIYDRQVIRKQKQSCSPRELEHIKNERKAVANFVLENGLADTEKIDYMQRKDEDGNIKEIYSERDLKNAGLNIN